jgi:putative FmdB family regulatory protein
MPIYAYKCSSCGHAKDVLQKLSDAPLSECPACGATSFSKQVTAAGFQLKGNGWYVTDFRDSNKKKEAKTPDADKSSEPAAGDAVKPGATETGTAKPASTGTAKPAESGATAASPPASSTPTPSA